MIFINNVISKIRKYKELKADIKEIDIKLQELREEKSGITAQAYTERTGKTYKITSITENQAFMNTEEIEKLEKEKKVLQRKLERIENAISVLEDEEKEVIVLAHIELKKWWRVESELHKSYSRLKQLECEATRKMEKYV